ncbi:MAG TPA: hypothetical protein VGU22_03390 [Methylomirabilota bacterium]|nr:hypothetical protein [Methylomirabilota bacterium]
MLAVVLGVALAGCATVERTSADAKRGVEANITAPMRYRIAGADPTLRTNLDSAQVELAAGNHRGAIPLLNRALWDVERIQKRALRLTELVVVYDSLAQAYAAMGILDLAEEARRLARSLTEATGREPAPGAIELLARAKDAYVSAQFREALRGLRQALVDLADIVDVETRIASVAQTRCYLAFAYFATQERSRVRDELRRLSVFDPSFDVCGRDAPPGVRALIADLRRQNEL